MVALESLYEKHGHWQLVAQLIEERLQRVTDLSEGTEAAAGAAADTTAAADCASTNAHTVESSYTWRFLWG